MTEEKLVDKLNGGTDKQILGYVTELHSLNDINPSPKPEERKNLPDDRNTEVNNAISNLEAVIKKVVGKETTIISDKDAVEKLVDALVEQGRKLPDAKEKPKDRVYAVQEYISQAGVNYGELLRTTVGLKGGVKINDLPENHPLRTLVRYIATKKVPNEDRVNFDQRQILNLGVVKPSSVAEAFNKVAGLNLDPRYATPQETLAAYNAKMQAKLAEYRANDPNVVYNKKAA